MAKRLTVKDLELRGGVEIAEHDGFTLFEFPEKASGKWRSFYLRRDRKSGPKSAFWFGWNGQRFGRNRDTEILETHYPEVADWIRRELSE